MFPKNIEWVQMSGSYRVTFLIRTYTKYKRTSLLQYMYNSWDSLKEKLFSF